MLDPTLPFQTRLHRRWQPTEMAQAPNLNPHLDRTPVEPRYALLQGPPPANPVPEVVGISVHLTFARRAFELAAWYRARGSKVIILKTAVAR